MQLHTMDLYYCSTKEKYNDHASLGGREERQKQSCYMYTHAVLFCLTLKFRQLMQQNCRYRLGSLQGREWRHPST